MSLSILARMSLFGLVLTFCGCNNSSDDDWALRTKAIEASDPESDCRANTQKRDWRFRTIAGAGEPYAPFLEVHPSNGDSTKRAILSKFGYVVIEGTSDVAVDSGRLQSAAREYARRYNQLLYSLLEARDFDS